jgi:hypothetical protein
LVLNLYQFSIRSDGVTAAAEAASSQYCYRNEALRHPNAATNEIKTCCLWSWVALQTFSEIVFWERGGIGRDGG